MILPTIRFSAIPLLSLLLLVSCGNDPATESRTTPGDTATGHAPGMPESSTGTADTAHSGGTADNAVTGGSRVAPPVSVRTALVDSVQRFVAAVGSGEKERFWSMLSRRSMEAVGTESGGTRDQVWEAARETLGSLQRPAVRFIGGTSDSVSLLVDRRVVEAGDTMNDPVVIHFLREQGEWKAIYPGLLYPEHELRD